jgi:hypothetical protein
MAAGAGSGQFGQHAAPIRPPSQAEYRFVPQRLENLAVKLAGEVYCACNAIVELDEQPVLWKRGTFTTRGII